MEIERPKPKLRMPDDAKLVFKGVVYDVYHWQQKLFDGSTATFERLKRHDTACVIAVTEDKKIILLNEEQPGRLPYLAIIGGRIEEEENPLDAAKRELLEESGYYSEDWELFIAEQFSSKFDWATFIFVARKCKKVTEQKLDPGEKIQVKLVDFEEFLDLASGETFHDNELKIHILEAKLHPQKKEELRKIILD